MAAQLVASRAVLSSTELVSASVANANAIPVSPILFTLKTEVMRSFETLVLTRATRRNILEDSILHIHRCENIKSYIALTGWAL
jgi:hypothetical protein